MVVVCNVDSRLGDMAGSFSSVFLTKKGDKFKKGKDAFITCKLLFLRDFYRYRFLIAKNHLATRDEACKVIQRYYLAKKPNSMYFWRVSRKTLYGEKLYIENRLKVIRNSDDYPNKMNDMAYWLGRQDEMDLRVSNSLSSPNMVILKKEIDLITENTNHHLEEIKVINTMIKKLKEKKDYHNNRVIKNQKAESNINDKIIQTLDANYEKDLQKARDDYETDFYTWGEKLGIPKTALAPNGEKDPNLFKAYVSGNPFKPPIKPSEKKVIKKAPKNKGEHAETGGATGDKPKRQPKNPPLATGDNQCIGLKLFKDNEGKWAGWCQCENKAVLGEEVCKRHRKNITGGGEGVLGKLGTKYEKDIEGSPSKWFKTITQTCELAYENREIAGLNG